MKQHITKDQVLELSENGQRKLREWWFPKANMGDVYQEDEIEPEESIMCCEDEIEDRETVIPLLSIGQMIDFLDSEQKYTFSIFRRTVDWKVIVNESQYGKVLGQELCDSLWEACKDILEKPV